MSSRNAYLSNEERRAANVLNRALMKANAAYDEGERAASQLIDIVRTTIKEERLARIDYVSLNDAGTLDAIDELEARPALLSLAVFFGKTRLIDNIVLGAAEKQIGANA